MTEMTLTCQPADQSIAELSTALLASRSAITGAVTLDPQALDPIGFAGATYQEQAD